MARHIWIGINMAASRDRSGKKVTEPRGKKLSKGSNITTGKVKAVNKAAAVAEKMGPMISGKNSKLKIVDSKDSYVKVSKNKNIKKELTRADKTPPYTSRRSAIKETNLQSRWDKHPLIRNTGEPAAENKYRGAGGKSVPVKPKNKTPKTVARGAAFGKKPNKPAGGRGLRGGMGGGVFGIKNR
jgi:hypothetical protein